MNIWIATFIYMGLLGYFVQNYYNKKNIQTKYDSKITWFAAILIVSLPVFLIGMRSNYGDTLAYIDRFNSLSTDFSVLWSQRKEIDDFGFQLYQYIIKRFISDDPTVFLMITAIIQGAAILKLYYKYSTNFTYSILLFFLSMAFTYMMNGLRQFLAASIIILFSEFLFQKKTIRFILVVLLASTIHSTAIVWIPIYFIVQGKSWNFKVIFSMLVVVMIVLALDNFTNLLSDSLENTEYAGYTNQFEDDDGSSFTHTIIALIPTAFALWKKKEIEEKNDHMVFVLVNCSVVEVLINVIANFTSGILVGRMPIYFKPFAFVLLPWIFDNVVAEKDRRMLKTICLIGYALFAIYYMYSQNMDYVSSVLGIV